MGIKGLWKEVAPITRSSHLSEFKGLGIGIDSYCWMHKFAVQSVAQIEETGACDRFIAGFMGRVDLVLRCGAKPVLVFDGRAMPMKAATDAERKKRRRAARDEARALMQQGNMAEAAAVLEKSVEITADMAYAVIRVAKERGIRCFVAPYEADAQLAFLCKIGIVQCALSEDSDMLVYNCPVLIAKLDSQGTCDTVRTRDLRSLPGFAGLSYEAFVLIAIMAGCDYVANLPGVGIKGAIKAVAGGRTMHDAIKAVSASAGLTARELSFYEEQVHKAFYCFAHHLVYDPVKRCIVPINAFPAGVEARPDLLGTAMPADAAVRTCEEHTLDPETGAPYADGYAPSVDAYWRRVRGAGQRTLADIAGFGASVRQPAPITNAGAGGTSEATLLARAAETKQAFTARRSDRGGAMSGPPPPPPQPQQPRRAVSKYFNGALSQRPSSQDNTPLACGAAVKPLEPSCGSGPASPTPLTATTTVEQEAEHFAPFASQSAGPMVGIGIGMSVASPVDDNGVTASDIVEPTTPAVVSAPPTAAADQSQQGPGVPAGSGRGRTGPARRAAVEGRGSPIFAASSQSQGAGVSPPDESNQPGSPVFAAVPSAGPAPRTHSPPQVTPAVTQTVVPLATTGASGPAASRCPHGRAECAEVHSILFKCWEAPAAAAAAGRRVLSPPTSPPMSAPPSPPRSPATMRSSGRRAFPGDEARLGGGRSAETPRLGVGAVPGTRAPKDAAIPHRVVSTGLGRRTFPAAAPASAATARTSVAAAAASSSSSSRTAGAAAAVAEAVSRAASRAASVSPSNQRKPPQPAPEPEGGPANRLAAFHAYVSKYSR